MGPVSGEGGDLAQRRPASNFRSAKKKPGGKRGGQGVGQRLERNDQPVLMVPQGTKKGTATGAAASAEKKAVADQRVRRGEGDAEIGTLGKEKEDDLPGRIREGSFPDPRQGVKREKKKKGGGGKEREEKGKENSHFIEGGAKGRAAHLPFRQRKKVCISTEDEGPGSRLQELVPREGGREGKPGNVRHIEK